MTIDLNLVRCFAIVAAKGSISHASSALHLSQPAISLQIQRLEEQIGRKLFERHNRGLILSAFGVQFLERSRRLMDLQDDLINLVQKEESEPLGLLKIGTYTTASSYLVSGTVSQFLQAYPKVSVSYKYEDSRSLLKKVKDHQLDCAILSDIPVDHGLESKVFYKDELIYAVSSKLKEAKLKQISANRLSEIDFLSYPLRYDLCYRMVESKFGAHLAKARVRIETESFDTLKQMLMLGAGATFIPKYLVKNEIQSGRLAEIKIGNARLPINFSFVTKKDVELPKSTQVFRDSLYTAFLTSAP